MKKQVLIVGLGRFGSSLATTFFNLGHDVLAIDENEKKVQAISAQITHAVQADATDEAVLTELGVSNFDVAVVAIGEDIQSSVLTTILLKKLKVPYVIARAENELHGSILDKIGADRVVYPEQEIGIRVAHGVALRGLQDYVGLAPGYGIGKLGALPHFLGKSLSDLELDRGNKWGLAVLLILREKGVIVTPDRSEIIKPDDILIVAGSDVKLEQFLFEIRQVGKEP